MKIVWLTCLLAFFSAAVPAAKSDMDDWPGGSFSVLAVNGQCPADMMYGRRFQHMDDPPGTSYGCGQNDTRNILEWEFCSGKSNNSDPWPKGNYCIHRFGGICPPGFKTGYIYMDDKDCWNPHSRNEGVIPDREVYGNTLYEYCCRDDGPIDPPIDLPPTEAFMMYPFTDDCQQVKGMTVSETYVDYNGEDAWNMNYFQPMHPKVLNKTEDFTFTFCKYEPLK